MIPDSLPRRSALRVGILYLCMLCMAALVVGCRAVPPVALDLARVAPLAERESTWELVLFGTPEAEAHHVSGFVWASGGDGRDGWAWAAVQSELSFRWPAPATRLAVFDLAAYPGLSGQSVAVTLNGTNLGRLSLSGARRRYALPLPAELQQAGRNLLHFTFAQGAAPQKPHRLHLAAAFYALAVGPAADARLLDLAAPSAPPALSLGDAVETRGPPTLVQAGPGVLRFAFLAPADGAVRFSPDLHAAARRAGGAATLRVTLQEEGGRERELWQRRIESRDRAPREVALALRTAPGTPVGLGLHVEGDRFAWATWSAPRVLGRGEVRPPISTAPRDPSRAAALRAALRGSNVVFVILDAAGARHFSCYGYSRETTPEIDRIAREGVLFEDAVSPVGFTLLSMSSIWTSQLPDQHHNGIPYNAKLASPATTLAEALSAAGVPTAAFVDNLFAGTAYGLDQGFASFVEVHRLFPHGAAPDFRPLLARWLDEQKKQPFFAYLHFREPHFPYNPPAPFNTLFGPEGPLPRAARTELDWLTDVNWDRKQASPEEVAHLVRLYDGNLRRVDGEVGALRRALEERGLWDKTLLILSADHGEALHEHAFIGHLTEVHEEILHVPLILHLPKGKGPAGVRVKGLAELIDVAPTVADVFGLAPPGFAGRSLLEPLAGAPGKTAVVSRSAEDQPKYALRSGPYKLVYHTARASQELYDLAADPGERSDLAERLPVRAALYRQALHDWLLGVRRGPRAAAEETRLTDEQREQLKALGYLR